ncbi:MAG: AMP-binding protein [Candidatus Pelagadaptatus aseana]|uniref:AMP-binding protein n=1 Tax=Candidatus Pelagadaptatus aseana TaxID=3120508 RepID=UPI0039B2C3E2
MQHNTLIDYLNHWARTQPDRIWLRQFRGDSCVDYSWSDARTEITDVAAALEHRFGNGANMLLLSANCAHWVLSDLAIIASGNITVPLFTTHTADTAGYIAEFTGAKVIFVGHTENWAQVRPVLSDDTLIISLPGVEMEEADLTWQQLVDEGRDKTCVYQCEADDVISLVFTSGTTGKPKGVIQTHRSNLTPIVRGQQYLNLGDYPRYFSYLPLSHLAERQLVEFTSLCEGGEVFFNESKETLITDLQRAKPHFFFGAPRVWEQLQHAVIDKFGGIEKFDSTFNAMPKDVGALIVEGLGLNDVKFCLTGSAPTPVSLTEWWQKIGIQLMDGFGQTEAMTLIVNTPEDCRLGSVGKPLGEVECKLSDEGELLIKAQGLTPGYYQQPEKTAELLQDGWLHTGDKARIDEDGFVFITGRVKDYFKTIQGKFVSPVPIESEFSKNALVEQRCLLGRGLSKTVMVLVLTDAALDQDKLDVEDSIAQTVEQVNATTDKHARIGAVIICKDGWTINNEFLTPTLKVRREMVQDAYGDTAEQLARRSAEQKSLLIHWCC